MCFYLITGGAGFIGSHFVKYLLRKYSDIQLAVLDNLTYAGNLGTIKEELKDSRFSFIKGNIGDFDIVNSIFMDYPINYVVNFAAESHVDKSIVYPQLFLETNVLGTQNLLETAKKHWTIAKDQKGYPIYKKGVKYLQISTDEVYGSLGKTGFFTETTPLCPHNPYSASKAAADLMVKAYYDTYKMPINITRCSNNYGTYHFPEKLIPLTIQNILDGKSLPVYGNGQNVRDWLYVEDHCKAVDLVLKKGRIGEMYNIGGHNEWKNIEIVKFILSTLKKLLEKNLNYRQKFPLYAQKSDLERINEDLILFVQDRLGHDRRYAVDPAKITAELGWQPETSFEKGILETIHWYLDNQDWVKEVISENYLAYYEQMHGKY